MGVCQLLMIDLLHPSAPLCWSSFVVCVCRDGHDLANLHAMNVHYLQQVASQRSHHHPHPNRQPIPQPPTHLFSAKM